MHALPIFIGTMEGVRVSALVLRRLATECGRQTEYSWRVAIELPLDEMRSILQRRGFRRVRVASNGQDIEILLGHVTADEFVSLHQEVLAAIIYAERGLLPT